MTSLCFHSLMASLSTFMGWAVSFGTGHVVVPSKWPQQCIASMASWKHVAKVAQLEASSVRCGTVLESTRKDIVNVIVTICSNDSWFSYWARAVGTHYWL